MADEPDLPSDHHDPVGTRDVVLRSGRGARGNGRRWTFTRGAFACCKLGAGLLVLMVVAAGILTVRLQQGPISVDGLGDKISSALQQRFGNGVRFGIGATSLVQRGFGPTVMIDRLTVSGPDGQSILAAPKAEISVDPFALLFGKVVPRRLEVFDVTLRMVLLQNGSLAVGAADGSKPFFEFGHAVENPADGIKRVDAKTGETKTGDALVAPGPDATALPSDPATPTAPRRPAVMKEAAAGIRQFIDLLTDPHSAIAAVDRLGISRGTLVIEDEVNKQEVVYKDLGLAFDKSHETTHATLAAMGPNGRWSIAATANGRPGAARHFGVKADNLSIDELQLAAARRSLGLETDMPFAATVDLRLAADNSLSEAAGGFDLGPGFYRLDDPDQEPVFVNRIKGGFHWNGPARRIEIDPIRYVEGDTHVTLGGTVTPPRDEGQPWSVKMAATEPGLLAPDRKGQQPVPVDALSFDGRLELDQKRFDIDRFAFRSGTSGIALAGAIDWVAGPHIRFGASIDPTPVSIVQRLWPAFMAAPVRAWILSHFQSGLVNSATMKIDYHEDDLKRMRADRAPADQSVSLDFALTKGRLIFLDGVPPLNEIIGHGHITGRTSHFYMDSGSIDASGKTIAVSKGLFQVENSNIHPTPASVSATLTGRIEAVTDLLSRDALKPYAAMPLDPTTLHGQIEGHLEKDLTLGPKSDSADDALRVDAKLTDFRADKLIGKEGLEDGTVAIQVGAGTLKATGQGRLFGGPATFEITRNGLAPPNAVIAVTLDDAARQKLGLSTIPGVSGPIGAHVVANLGDPAKIKAQVELDLTKTAVAAAYLGLSKPAGKPARIAFSTVPRDNRMTIDPLVVDVGTLQAHGAVDLGDDNGFRSARFSSFKVSPGDDMKLDVAKDDNNTLKLTIRGSTIDARPFLKALTTTPANDATPISRSAKAEKAEVDTFSGLDVDLKSNILSGFNKEVMSGVDLKLVRRGTQISQFAVQGRFGHDTVSGSMSAAHDVKIATQDAGALVSFVDLYKHMEGGSLSATMKMGEDALSGYLEIRDFVLRDEPALRRLVAQSTTVSAPGENEDAARRINGGAAGFKRLKVNFERIGSRLELKDATMYGPEIGLSVDGWLDYSHDKVAMNGTFVPAFAVNNLFSQIPVFGVFLGGKSNEGLLAITFRISGLASSPTLSINPLSAITPGFLRNIFGILDNPNGGQPAFPSGAPSR